MRSGKVMLIALVLILALPLAVLAADDPNERKEQIKGNGVIITVRFDLGTEGMGVAQCGTCSTAAGCKSVWCRVGTSLSCKATPAPKWKFDHWTANGNFAGDKPTIQFCRKGADLKAHFEKAK